MKNLYWLAAGALAAPLAAQAQAPTISSLAPARHAVAADRAANVVLTFSQPLGAGLPASALRVFSSQRGGRLAGTLVASGNTLTFDPTRDFRVGEEVSVTATTGIRSSSGTALAAPLVYRFRARPVGGTGVLGARAVVAVGQQPIFIATADVDGDRDLDLLTANQADNTVSVRLNDGAGTFAGGSTVAVGVAPISLTTADVDGDGDLDLLCANKNSNTVSVRLNDGLGSFGGTTEVGVGTLPIDVKTADVDGDGDLDLLAATSDVPAVVSVRLNDGNGTFGGGPDVPAQLLLTSLATADIDNDGDLDLLAPINTVNTGTAVGSRVVVLLNNGSGSFSAGPVASVGAVPWNVAVGDIDNDGDVDLLTANNYSNNSVSIRLNDGAGGFGGGTELPVNTNCRSVALADMDGDGDLDLVVAGASPGLSVFLNSGTGVFSPAGTYVVGGPFSVATADVDGDGDLDVLTANNFSGTVEVRLNNGTGAPLAAQPGRPAPALALWPNPARGRVQLTQAGAGQVVELLDLTGRRLLRQAADATGSLTLDLPAHLAAGTYLVRSASGQGLLVVE